MKLPVKVDNFSGFYCFHDLDGYDISGIIEEVIKSHRKHPQGIYSIWDMMITVVVAGSITPD